MSGFYLASGDDEVAGDRRLAAAGRLEVDHRASAHGGWDRHAALSDRVLARNGELIDAAIDLPLHANGTVQGGRVEFDLCGLRRGRRRRPKWRLALAKRGADGSCYGDRIAMPMNVHVVGRQGWRAAGGCEAR